jgi:hypothetical protein
MMPVEKNRYLLIDRSEGAIAVVPTPFGLKFVDNIGPRRTADGRRELRLRRIQDQHGAIEMED